MNNYDDEATQYQNPDNEATRFEDTTSKQTNDETTAPLNNDEVEVKAAKGSTWKRAAVGAGSGLFVGGVATVLMSMKKPDGPDNDSGKKDDSNHKDELSNPEWVDDEIAVATSVNDDMSFGEAFAAARTEVGPGGCFEWHGNVYGTYTADEWNNMTAEQQADWSDHFSWNHIDHSESHVAQHSTAAQHASSNATVQTTANDDDIEVVSVNHTENNDIAQNQPQNNVHQTSNEVEEQSSEPEIEILGVVHDDETNTNIGGMKIDGQDVILVDIDNDLAFDYMAADANNNNQIDRNELVDIQDQNLTVNDLGGFSNPAGDLYANDEGPDYSNDGVYES